MAATTVFGKILESATKHGPNTTAGTADQLHLNFMNGIADYLEQHVTLSGTFSGTNGTSSMTSPLTVSILATTLRADVLSGASGFGSWSNTFYTSLRTRPVVKPGTFTPTGLVPVFPTISMSWTQQDIASAADDNGEGAHGRCMDAIGNGLIKDMKSGYIKSIPGSIGAYIGALSVSNITCD